MGTCNVRGIYVAESHETLDISDTKSHRLSKNLCCGKLQCYGKFVTESYAAKAFLVAESCIIVTKSKICLVECHVAISHIFDDIRLMMGVS
jgi:hypothetical protein